MNITPFYYNIYSKFPKKNNEILEPQIRTKRYLNEQFDSMGILTKDDEEKINITLKELIKIRSKSLYQENLTKFIDIKKNNLVTDEEYKNYIKKRDEYIKIMRIESNVSRRDDNSENVHKQKEYLEENLWNAIKKSRREQFFKPKLEITKKLLDIFIKKLKCIISNKDYDLIELTNKLDSNIDICKSCYEKIRSENIHNLDFDKLFGFDQLIKEMTLEDFIKEKEKQNIMIVSPRKEFDNTFEYWKNYSQPINYNKTHKITSKIVNDYKNKRRNIVETYFPQNNNRQQIAEPKNSRNSDKIKVYWDMIVRYRESEIKEKNVPINAEIGKLLEIFIEELDYIVNNYDTNKELQKIKLKNLIESSIKKYELYLEKMTKK